MALLELVEAGQGHVGEVRHELDRVREVLDRTDAMLSVTDDALDSAQTAIVTSRRVAPYVALAAGLAAAAVLGYVIWRRRQRADEEY